MAIATQSAYLVRQRAQFQPQRVAANKSCSITLIVCSPRRVRLLADRHIAVHRRNFWIVKALGTLAACDDDVALVKLQAHDAGDVALRFGDQPLQCFAFQRKPKTVSSVPNNLIKSLDFLLKKR